MSQPDESAPNFDWQAFVFDPTEQWIEQLSRIAERRFAGSAKGEAAFNYALEKVSADQWRLLQGYDGVSRPGTYLTVIFKRLLEDYSRETEGRARPPAWLARAGELWLGVHRMLCFERADPASIIQRYSRGQAAVDSARLQAIMREIKAKIPNCGEVRGDLATDSVEPHVLNEVAAPDDVLLGVTGDEDASILQALGALLSTRGEEALAASHDSPLLRALSERGADRFGLSADELLVLRLHYLEQLKFAPIGRAIGLPEHKVRRLHRRALDTLGERLGDIVRGLRTGRH